MKDDTVITRIPTPMKKAISHTDLYGLYSRQSFDYENNRDCEQQQEENNTCTTNNNMEDDSFPVRRRLRV